MKISGNSFFIVFYRPVFFAVGLLLFSLIGFSQAKTQFPLKLGENKRYLIDQNNKPFLIKEFSAWGLIQILSEKDEAAFLDSIKRKGFNTVMTSVISNAPSQMGGNPPYWQGISPFNVQWDFSTPNETYFKHVDRFFKMAEEKGFFVMAVPCYFGYNGDPSQGWSDEVLHSKNDTSKMRSYGEFLGKRYKETKNIMWLAGGDNNAKEKLFPFEANLIAGIKQYDKDHLWSGHFDMHDKVIWSTDHSVFGEMMDIDGLYVWTESVLFERGPQYKTQLEQYRKGKMTMQLDLSYEHDVPHFADNENYQWMRRKMYDGLLSGCAGTSFSSGETDNFCYSFKNWKPLMNTRGMKQTANCFRFFELLPWHQLVPDETTDIITIGRGVFGQLDYICAARATDKSCYVMYIPEGHNLEMNTKNISDKPMQAHWYNPSTGDALRIGTVGPSERYAVSPPSEEDWVLVFDNFKLMLPGKRAD